LKWGVLENKLAEPTRRQLALTTQTPSLVTGTMVLYYPTWKRVLRQSVTTVAILTMLALVVFNIFGQVEFQRYILPQDDTFATNSVLLFDLTCFIDRLGYIYLLSSFSNVQASCGET
jgi:hypothetical protein